MVFLGPALGPLSHMRAEPYSPSDQFARKDYSIPCTLLKPQLRHLAGNNRTFLQVWSKCFGHINHIYPATCRLTASAIFFSHVSWRHGCLATEWWALSAGNGDKKEHRVNKRNRKRSKIANCLLFTCTVRIYTHTVIRIKKHIIRVKNVQFFMYLKVVSSSSCSRPHNSLNFY